MDIWVAFLSAIVNNGAVNKGYTCLLRVCFEFFGGICPKVELLDCVFFFLSVIFWGTAVLFFHSSYNIYIPINSAQRFQFFHSVSNTCYFLSFLFVYNSHVNGCEVTYDLSNVSNIDLVALKNIINLISVLAIWLCPCVESSLRLNTLFHHMIMDT